MNRTVVDCVQALGEAGVAVRADVKSFMRGGEIMAMDMDPLVYTGTRLKVQVVGTEPYVVVLGLGGASISENAGDAHGGEPADELEVACTCPVPRAWCKHVVAVALRILREPEWAAGAPYDHDDEDDHDDDAPVLDDDITVRRVINSTLGIMRKRDLIVVLNQLRAAKPTIEPTVTKLVMPYASKPEPQLEDVQKAIDATRALFEHARTDDDLYAAAEQLDYTGNVIRSHAAAGNEEQLLCALETLMLETSEQLHYVAMPVGAVVEALERLYLHHGHIARIMGHEAEAVIEWLLDTYFAPGDYLPTILDEYVDLLDDGDLDELIERAHKHRPLHPRHVLPLEIDVALARNDMHELKRLCGEYELFDALLEFYERNGMDLGAQELVAAAMDIEDPVVLSPDRLFGAAMKYFQVDGMRQLHRYWFQADPNQWTFRSFITQGGVDFAEALYVLQTVEEAAGDPNYVLLAATQFERFDIGFGIITTENPQLSLSATFAEKVAVHYDPVWAMGVMFADVKEFMWRTLDRSSVAAKKAALNKAMGRIIEIRKITQRAMDSSDDNYIEWLENLAALREEFSGATLVQEAFKEWGFTDLL